MDPEDEDECLTKAIGTDIQWKPGKNITVRAVEKKQKKKGKVRALVTCSRCVLPTHAPDACARCVRPMRAPDACA